jgi:hypothetical protein
MRIPRILQRADHPQRGHARVDLDALLGERLERPQRPIVHRPFRRTEQGDRRSADRRQRAQTVAKVVAKGVGAEVVGALMQVPVRSNFVARIADRRDELGMALGDPPDDEDRGADIRAIEEIQQQAGRELDARRQRVPALGRERRPPPRRCETTLRDRS